MYNVLRNILPSNDCYYHKIKKTQSLKKAHHVEIENIAGSVWLSLFMDVTG
jgi:hypothetical protein